MYILHSTAQHSTTSNYTPNHKIETCCICGKNLQQKISHKFIDLPGSGTHEYSQNVAICPECGLIVTQNPFTPEQLANRYKNMSKFEYDATNYILEQSAPYRKQCHHQKNFIDENIGSENYSSILEIGASSGYNLSIYEGKKRYGIEPSALNCELARKNYGVDMFNGMWSEYLSSNHDSCKYDIVFLSMVLEHIVDPCRFILECGQFCNKYFFIEVPVLDYKFLDEPFGMFAEEHVNIFTLHSLSVMMKHCGFSLVNCQMTFAINSHLPAGYPSIASIWRRDDKAEEISEMFTDSAKLDKYIETSRVLLREIERKINAVPDDERIALWGVGHYASMLLANSCLCDKNIVRVYDSDTRKTGLVLEGHEVRPFTPEDAENNHVDGIVITTFTAQDAIHKALINSGWRGKIYILH